MSVRSVLTDPSLTSQSWANFYGRSFHSDATSVVQGQLGEMKLQAYTTLARPKPISFVTLPNSRGYPVSSGLKYCVGTINTTPANQPTVHRADAFATGVTTGFQVTEDGVYQVFTQLSLHNISNQINDPGAADFSLTIYGGIDDPTTGVPELHTDVICSYITTDQGRSTIPANPMLYQLRAGDCISLSAALTVGAAWDPSAAPLDYAFMSVNKIN